jgi:hypothetical protein
MWRVLASADHYDAFENDPGKNCRIDDLPHVRKRRCSNRASVAERRVSVALIQRFSNWQNFLYQSTNAILDFFLFPSLHIPGHSRRS